MMCAEELRDLERFAAVRADQDRTVPAPALPAPAAPPGPAAARRDRLPGAGSAAGGEPRAGAAPGPRNGARGRDRAAASLRRLAAGAPPALGVGGRRRVAAPARPDVGLLTAATGRSDALAASR